MLALFFHDELWCPLEAAGGFHARGDDREEIHPTRSRTLAAAGATSKDSSARGL